MMISTTKKNTLNLNLKAGDFNYIDGKIKKLNSIVKPLHPNHGLIYYKILKLNPGSILEAGCGSGDHLINLLFFSQEFNINRVDRYDGQLATLRERHHSLSAVVSVADLTNSEITMPSVDLVYS